MSSGSRTVHHLKVTLRTVKPPVWRRILVPSEVFLAELAPILERAMGWLGGHLHLFDIYGALYGQPDPDWDVDYRDEGRYRLAEVLPTAGSKMRWDYDFGDGWEHDVLVEAVSLTGRGAVYPICTGGRRACPPDDCGGPWSYMELLELLSHPDMEDPDDRRASVEGFDPASFNAHETSEAMRAAPLW